MKVKDLLNFIAIEVEAGRLSEDAQINVCGYLHDGFMAAGVTEADADSSKLLLTFEI